MKKTKLKLKKRIWVILALLIFIPILIFATLRVRENYLYKQTYEYKLLEIGYTKDETKLLTTYLEDAKLDELLLKEKDEVLLSLMKNSFYNNNNLDRYLNYLSENQVDTNEAIKMVNISRDYDFYEISYNTDESKEYTMLVNKYYLLSESYKPSDLVEISTNYCWGENKYIRTQVYDAFLDMHSAAEEAGYYLMINSGFRSYQEQQEVYDYYKNLKGEKYADSIAARPGASEHQTGLALDIFEIKNSSTKTFKDSDAYLWLKENAHKYGFIVRYEENMDNITGYAPEAWHYRYVGIDVATDVYQKDLTYDEYYEYYIK